MQLLTLASKLKKKIEKTKQNWRIYKLKHKYTNSKPFRGSLVFCLVCLLIISLIATGIFLFTRNRQTKNTDPTYSASDKDSKATAVQETGEFAGWVPYTGDELSISFHYPPTWSVENVDGKQMINIHTMDNRYFLYFGLRPTGASEPIQVEKGLPSGETMKEGQIVMLGTTVEKEKIVQKNLAKAYLYGKNINVTSDGKYQFAASFLADPRKVDLSELDLTLLDQRAIGEKILNSIKLK